jgi:N-acetylmuramate 1-kinase
MELAATERLLRQAGYARRGLQAVTVLAGDGSDRLLYRCRFAQDPSVVLIMPPGRSSRELAEAASCAAIGRHLSAAGVPVPAIHGYDPVSGAVVMEDLGDLLLHARLQQNPDPAEIEALYRQALTALLQLQVTARSGFSPAFCWDTPRYDRDLMLARESGYFYQALVREWLGQGPMGPELAAEFARLADRAGAEPADFILHRDYQCRNLMLSQGRIRIIDFQGARFGPLGYDLAALLYDPYAALTPALREALLAFYLEEAGRMMAGFDREAFRRGWYFLALQRNLQILGAFAFLTRRKGKVFFRAYLQPAAAQLLSLLAAPGGENFPVLQNLAAKVDQELSRARSRE